MLQILGESENEEAWPNADLAIRSSSDGALIVGLPADKVKAGDEREKADERSAAVLLDQEDKRSPRKIDSAHWLGTTKKGSEVRSRCVLKNFATTVRNDVFSSTRSPLSVLLYAAWYDLRIETGDLVCAFIQADSSSETYARPPKWQKREGWIWKLHGAMNGMRTASRDFTEFLAGILTKHMGFKRGKLERFVHEASNVDDPLICAKLATLEKFWTQITHSCGVPGIRVPKCARSWTWRFHSEAEEQIETEFGR